MVCLSESGHDNRFRQHGACARGIAANAFGDAEQALEHLVGGGPDPVVRIDSADLAKVIDSVLADQQDDGSWPTLHDPAWRPWTTASTLATLNRLQEFEIGSA